MGTAEQGVPSMEPDTELSRAGQAESLEAEVVHTSRVAQQWLRAVSTEPTEQEQMWARGPERAVASKVQQWA